MVSGGESERRSDRPGATPGVTGHLATWLPPLVWTAVVLRFSSETWSAESTAGFVMPLLGWLMPWATPAQIAFFHGLGRKAAHFTEYAILSALWYRAFVRGRSGSRRTAELGAFAVAIACAIVDEVHQSVTASRIGSPLDVLLDATGAIAALATIAYGWRLVTAITTALFWLAAIGGAAFLIVNHISGVDSGPLWFTTPLAIAALLFRHYLGRHSSR